MEFTIGITGTAIAIDGRSVSAKVVEGRVRLERLRELIRRELSRRNLVNGGFTRKPFDPHVTLLKARHNNGEEATIDPSCYSEVADLDFGVQRCRSVQLLAMSGDRGGFYPKLGRVTLGRESGEAAASIAEEEEEAEERLKELCTPLKPEPNVFIAIQVSITTALVLTAHTEES